MFPNFCNKVVGDDSGSTKKSVSSFDHMSSHPPVFLVFYLAPTLFI